MKGPGLRTGLDVRRVWRCAKCGRTARTGGQIVAQRCGCSEAGHWMVLQPPVKREPFIPPLREPLFDPGAEEPLSRSPPAAVEAIGDAARGAAGTIAPEQAGSVHETAAEQSIIDEQSPCGESPPTIEVLAEQAERAPLPPTGEGESGTPATESSPPDDFGAGLGSQ